MLFFKRSIMRKEITYMQVRILQFDNKYKILIVLEQWVSNFWFQDPFTLLKLTEDFKELLLCGLYISIFTTLEIKMDGI